MNDIIIGLATTLGQSSVAIIRLSGDKVIDFVDQVFSHDLKNCQPNTISYGYIEHDNEIIDEVLISVFHGPNSFTAEDVVEINCHGGVFITRKIFNLLTSLGARIAEPGEFTKRAFLNGRINLTEAEAVMETIKANNDHASKLAIKSLQGSISRKIKELKQPLLDIIAELEVNIDYPEYEIPEIEKKQELLAKTLKEMSRMHNDSHRHNYLFNGVKVAILGKPNVGKSTILNVILDEEKAIVSDIAGTTRDMIEATTMLSGIPINLIDTAGIRETEDTIEKIGVDKALRVMEQADLILYTIDNNDAIAKNEEEIIKEQLDKVIVVVNKIDQNDKKVKIANADIVYISALNNKGIDKLKEIITNKLRINEINNNDLYLNERQNALIGSAIEELSILVDKFNELETEFLLIELRSICEKLSEITGEVYYDSLLDNIFASFCLGK